MCTGVEIALLAAGAAASAGGALVSRKEQQDNANRAARARNQELAATRTRLRGFEDKNRKEGVEKALGKFSKEEQAKTQEDATTRRDVAITEALGATPTTDAIPLEGAPEIIKGNMGKKLRDVFNTATAHAKLAAKPLTWQDTLQGNNIGLTEAGRLVDTYNSFARQEAAMLPAQQDFAAFAAQKDPSIWGPVLQAAGSAAAGAAGSGYLRPLAATAAAAAAPAAVGVYASPWADIGLRSAPA
jgi:hypothetical protein